MRSLMTPLRVVLTPLSLAVLLCACSSAPKPPSVDESTKRPANSAMAVELQSCRSDLQNTRITAKESRHLAESTTAAMKRRAALDQAASATAAAQAANSVFVVRFDFASARVVVPSEIEAALLEAARKAPLVMLRGRTDGNSDSAAESRVARERAETVRDYLIAAGVPASRIRATYQPVGDFATDNATAVGRDANRRVEIEVYRVLPVLYAPTPAQRG